MTDQERPAAAIEALASSLAPYSKAELQDMLAHVIKTYVIDGITPNKVELGPIDFPKHLRELAFPQLVAQLKIHLDLPELNLFTVTAGEVLVNLGGRDFSLTNPRGGAPRPSEAAPAAGGSAGGGTGGGGRDPFDGGAPRGRGESTERGAERDEKARPEEPKEVEISDRFRMLELD